MTEVKNFVRWEFISTDSQINFTIDPNTGLSEFSNQDLIKKGETFKYTIGARMADGTIEPHPEKIYVVE